MYVDDSKLPLVSLQEALEKADLVVVLVDHYEYRALDPAEIGKKVARKVVYDTRNALNHARWKAAGFQVHLLGSGAEPGSGS
ncbi:MAG TPA: UDP binding domain-containing protein, partial [Bacteroidota bacterium]